MVTKIYAIKQEQVSRTCSLDSECYPVALTNKASNIFNFCPFSYDDRDESRIMWSAQFATFDLGAIEVY